jgi:purine-binding chemotaxis protein CheW
MKNPFESLQDYFDELLPADDLSPHEKSTEVVSAHVLRAAAKAPVSNTVFSRKTESTRLPEYAEPDTNKRQKLQKLLSSTQPRIAVAPIVKVKTTFIEDPAEIQEWVIETATPIVETSTLETPAVIESEFISQRFHMPGLEWLPNGLPHWAQSRFDVLLFKVSGLTLAVPLISLGQIQPITDELTPLFGQADWFMGLQPTPQGKIRTVNTAKFVMPERYDESFVKNAKYVVSINGVPWGLAVDSVTQPIRLQPDEVKWRTDRSKRPWLAGTVKEHMCALLDIPMIGQMLMDADKNALKSRA